jgi:hypothetical protein
MLRTDEQAAKLRPVGEVAPGASDEDGILEFQLDPTNFEQGRPADFRIQNAETGDASVSSDGRGDFTFEEPKNSKTFVPVPA